MRCYEIIIIVDVMKKCVTWPMQHLLLLYYYFLKQLIMSSPLEQTQNSWKGVTAHRTGVADSAPCLRQFWLYSNGNINTTIVEWQSSVSHLPGGWFRFWSCLYITPFEIHNLRGGCNPWKWQTVFRFEGAVSKRKHDVLSPRADILSPKWIIWEAACDALFNLITKRTSHYLLAPDILLMYCFPLENYIRLINHRCAMTTEHLHEYFWK